MLTVKNKRVLVIGAHGDDIEMGCGGSLAKFVQEGAEIRSLVLSLPPSATPAVYTKDVLREEVLTGHCRLGITNVTIASYQVRIFPSLRQAILERLWALGQEFDPDLVIAHSMSDYHQDHQTVAFEVFRAFKSKTILGYSAVHNTRITNNQLFVELSKENVENKLAAIDAYHSQRLVRPMQFSRELSMSILRANGAQVGLPYAEIFDCDRLVMRS